MPGRKPGPKPKRKRAARKRASPGTGAPKGLSALRRRFVDEYLIDANGTQAAIRAGYSERTAGQQAEQLLKILEISEAIEAGQAELSRKAKTTAEWARRKLRQFAEADMRDFASWDSLTVTLKSSAELPEGLSQCIQEIAQTKDGVRIKLVDKRAAIADLRALDGLDAPLKSEHTGKDGAPLFGVLAVPEQADPEEWTKQSAEVHRQ